MKRRVQKQCNLMKRKSFFILVGLWLCFIGAAYAQVPPTKPKLCATCGKMYVNCPYKGNHPKCATCGKVKEKCPYRGNHPKCATCGKVKESCPYKGSHPKCDVCGKVKENCPYNGNHPKCVTCGKLKDACAYKGDHPKCSTCAKYIGASSNACPYDGKHPVVTKSEEPEEKVYDTVETMPRFPGDNGDMSALSAWLSSNLRYPLVALESGIQGTVWLQFVVGKDGSIRDVKVSKSVDPSLDREAVRVVKAMPKWVPGTQKGKPVSVRYQLPIRFKSQ